MAEVKRGPLLRFFLLSLLATSAPGAQQLNPPSVVAEDLARFTSQLSSPIAVQRLEGARGLSFYKHWPAETNLLNLLADPAPEVRRAAREGLCRVGTAKSIPVLIELLNDPAWDTRQSVWLALGRMTAQSLPSEFGAWSNWWHSASLGARQTDLFRAVTNGQSRKEALRALVHLAGESAEATLLHWLRTGPAPSLDPDEQSFVATILERIGTTNAIPVLAGSRVEDAAWALGRIGTSAAEQALLAAPKILSVLLNLDRVGSTNLAPWIPFLVGNMALVTYRSHPDDLMNPQPQPVQRVGANLIIRSGQAPLLIELVLQELEDSMKPAIAHAAQLACPASWTAMLTSMREELRPGFVRNDGVTTSQPLTALYHVAHDRALTPRLLPLLRHPAFVPRIYVAMLLGKLGAPEALPALLEIVREGYQFSDATALASGKHFDQSQTVRWRGFLCMAIGRMGGESARENLEKLAADPDQPRDIRYGAVVGLRFMGDPRSLPALLRISQQDLIWMTREEARQAAEEIKALHP